MVDRYFIFGWNDSDSHIHRDWEIGFEITGLSLRPILELDHIARFVNRWDNLGRRFGDRRVVHPLQEYEHIGLFKCNPESENCKFEWDEVMDLHYVKFTPLTPDVKMVTEIDRETWIYSNEEFFRIIYKYDVYATGITRLYKPEKKSEETKVEELPSCDNENGRPDTPQEVRNAAIYVGVLTSILLTLAVYFILL